jgi:hypothetical protein
MTRLQHLIVLSWKFSIVRAIQLHDADAAYRLTVGLMQRLRELGVRI